VGWAVKKCVLNGGKGEKERWSGKKVWCYEEEEELLRGKNGG
jgi:hypothetical protein